MLWNVIDFGWSAIIKGEIKKKLQKTSFYHFVLYNLRKIYGVSSS